MISREKINHLIKEKLEGTDFFLVELKISADNRIAVFLDSFTGIKIEDCVALSRYIDGNLDRDKEDFELEVSSAGIGLPFKVLEQYKKNVGQTVEVLTEKGMKLEGELVEVNEESFSIRYEKKVVVAEKKRKQLVEFVEKFAYNEVKSTKILLKL